MSMRGQLFFWVLTFAGVASAQLPFDPQQGPKPIAMAASSFSPFGSFTPSIVVYDDGQVICQQFDKNTGYYYAQKQLSSNELEVVKNSLATFGDWSQSPGLPRNFRCVDCGTTILYLNLGNKFSATRVMGLAAMKPGDVYVPRLPYDYDALESYMQRLSKLSQYLHSLRFASTKPWEPRFFKVQFLESWLDRKNPNVHLLHWPKNWPGLESTTTQREIALYSIYLPGAELSTLRSLVGRPNHSVAMQIEGKEGVANYKYVLPNERDWNSVLHNEERIP